ncbi:MAG: DUF3124 domain-containing protein [Desulfarculaceae bacterium]
MTKKLMLTAMLAMGVCLWGLQPGGADSGCKAVKGQTVYVPVYSQIYYYQIKRELNLAVTLSVRNTDMNKPLTITEVVYYDTDGNKLKNYQDKPTKLGPLATAEYVVEEKDTKGGAGANFIVRWTAASPVSQPVIESVMIGTFAGNGISFLSQGRVIEQVPACP